MSVQTIQTVEIIEDGATDKLLVEPLHDDDTSVPGAEWSIRITDSSTKCLHVTPSDLRALAHALLALIGDDE